MRIEELSVGDWVQDRNGKTAQIIGIELWSDGYEVNVRINGVGVGLAPASSCYPIPLTPEILEKNGFECVGGGIFNYDTVDLFYEDGKFYFAREAGYDKLLKVEHVHQLQHALRLAGIEKEIEV